MVLKKKCVKCGNAKALALFYRRPNTETRINVCDTCRRKRSIEYNIAVGRTKKPHAKDISG